MFEIKYPVGWNGTSFMSVADPNLHHILTFDYTTQDYISVVLHWNIPYDKIPPDEKYGFKDRHYHLKLSVNEAKELRDALDFHISNLERRRG